MEKFIFGNDCDSSEKSRGLKIDSDPTEHEEQNNYCDSSRLLRTFIAGMISRDESQGHLQSIYLIHQRVADVIFV